MTSFKVSRELENVEDLGRITFDFNDANGADVYDYILDVEYGEPDSDDVEFVNIEESESADVFEDYTRRRFPTLTIMFTIVLIGAILYYFIL